MLRLEAALKKYRSTAFAVAALVLFTFPAALYAAARAGNETLCWLLLGVVALTSAVVMRIK